MMDTLLFWFAAVVFIGTYVLIASERVHKTAAALAGASLMLIVILRPTSPEGERDLSVFSRYVDHNVVFTLAGMMIIVNVLRTTGFFQYMAIKCVKWTRASPLATLALFSVLTAVLSAWLDNVTTVLLIAPISLVVARQLRLDPVPFLIAEALASNVGGTATLIGDPPNLLIGSAGGLSFLDFLVHLTPIVVVALAVLVAAQTFWLRKSMYVSRADRAAVMDLDESKAITNRPLLRRTLIVTGITLVGFLLHGPIGIEPAVVAMGGAAALLVVSRFDVEKALAEVEWPTLFFFLGLFIVVAGAERVGLIDHVSHAVLGVVGRSPGRLAIAILWFSGLSVAVMNNISFTTAMLPVVEGVIKGMAEHGTPLTALHEQSLWWALALGACLGGNGTLVGAAANLVVADLARKDGHPISFRRFTRVGFPCSIASLFLASIYVYLRYYA
ncbi:MAG: ArsB/NhaD family transporter [Planctomycetes bacterium]|nr:ArsB/NhaD family transporter [Planctomycetota bacterium]